VGSEEGRFLQRVAAWRVTALSRFANALESWRFPGNVVPPVTPFDDAGAVDYPVLRREIDWVIASSRPAAICVAGVEAQEYQYLTDAARRELIRETIVAIDGRVPALVGVSHASYRRSIELTAYAHELGASAVQLLLPNRPSGGAATTAEIVAYFEAIVRESPLPVVAYHNQGPGADLGVPALMEVLAIDGVVGLKESSRNQRFLANLLREAQARKLGRIFTTLEVLLGTLILGAAGGTMPSPGSALAAILVEAFHAGDFPTAARLQQLLSEMPARWIAHGLVAVSKASMTAIGLDCGPTYPPFGAMPAKDTEEIRAFWESALTEFPVLRV
jgi:4-hydroxy-tetrahydrodipicolinate synthase